MHEREDKAQSFLKDAFLLFTHRRLASSLSRAYYALFHAALALLEAHGFIPEKREHRFVLAAFPREFVHKRKLFSRDTGEFLEKMYWLRVQADYGYKAFSSKQTQRELDRTKKLVETILDACEPTKR